MRMSNRVTDPGSQGRQNTYLRYMQADFNWPDNYPITAQLDAERYRPLATWMGRLILPHARSAGHGAGYAV